MPTPDKSTAAFDVKQTYTPGQPRSQETKNVTAVASDPMAEMQAELARLKAENERLKTKSSGPITLKVSEKGAISAYGLGRFPVTLYREQFTKLLDQEKAIRAFIDAHAGELSSKADKQTA